MTSETSEVSYQTLISDVIPPDAYPVYESEKDYKDRLLDFPYKLADVAKFGDLGELKITPQTRFIAYLIKNGDDTYDGYNCEWGVIASVYIVYSDQLVIVTPDGCVYKVNTDRLPQVFPPEKFGLKPFPYWSQKGQELENFMTR